jgi:hypothetical protein
MDGERHGLGKYYYFTETYYEGNWYKNKKEGRGIFQSNEGQYNG